MLPELRNQPLAADRSVFVREDAAMAQIERHVLYGPRKQEDRLSECVSDPNFVENVGVLPSKISDN